VIAADVSVGISRVIIYISMQSFECETTIKQDQIQSTRNKTTAHTLIKLLGKITFGKCILQPI
jgi:hypothetical protein